jgi:alginate O-acetyltransferase complex protein AlgI
MHLYTVLLVLVSWGLFYFDDLGLLGKFYSALFGYSTAVASIAEESALLNNFWLWIVALLFCMPVRQYAGKLTERLLAKHQGLLSAVNTTSRIVVSLVILILSIALLVGATNNAFIYTRF